jgi:hypothetical protein
MGDALSDVLVATEAERLATGFQFTLTRSRARAGQRG